MSTDISRGLSGRHHLVIEPGGEWLKILLASRAGAGASLLKTQVEKVDALKGLTTAQLTEALRRMDVRGAAVTVCLPRQAVTVRLVELPSTQRDELHDMVELQLGRLTPLSKDEVVFDYRVVGPGRPGYSRVLIAIVQRSLLRHRYGIIEEAGLSIRRLTVSTEGLLRWHRESAAGDEGGTVMTLDIDAGGTDVLIAEGDRVLFVKSIALGAADLGRAGAEGGLLDRLGTELRLCIEAFRAECPGGRIARVIVTGGETVTKHAELAAAVKSATGSGVEVRRALDVFSRAGAGGAPETSGAEAGVSLAGIAGVAMSTSGAGLNLVPDTVRLKKEMMTRARQLTQFAILVFVALTVVSAHASVKLFHARRHLADIRSESERMTADAAKIEQMAGLSRLVKARTNFRHSMVAILDEIQRCRTDDLDIQIDAMDFDADRNSLQLTGSGGSTDGIRRFVQTMEASPLFTEVQEGETTLDPRTRRYRYRLNAALEKDA